MLAPCRGHGKPGSHPQHSDMLPGCMPGCHRFRDLHAMGTGMGWARAVGSWQLAPALPVALTCIQTEAASASPFLLCSSSWPLSSNEAMRTPQGMGSRIWCGCPSTSGPGRTPRSVESSGVHPGSMLKITPGSSRDYMGGRELNPHQLRTRQTPSPLCYHSGPCDGFFESVSLGSAEEAGLDWALDS